MAKRHLIDPCLGTEVTSPHLTGLPFNRSRVIRSLV